MPLNVKEWLSDLQKKGNLSPSELQAMEAIIAKPAVAQEIVDSMERQSDYSRKMQELQAKQQQEDEYAARLSAWEADVKDQLARSEQAAKQYQQQLYTLASQYNVDPTELQKALQVTNTPTPTPASTPAPTQSAGLTREDVESVAANLFTVNAKLVGLNHEHIRLFGKPMEDIDKFAELALQAGKPIEQTFREHYKVAEREAQLAEERVQARIQEALDKAKLDWSAQTVNPMAVNANAPKGTQSPIFENIEIGERAPGENAAHRSRVMEAVAAFNQSQAAQGLPTV